MAYVKQNFIDGSTLYAEQLNHIEDGIVNIIQNDIESDSSTWSSSKINTNIGNKASTIILTGVLTPSGWVGGEAPFTKDVELQGILTTDIPIIDMVATGTYSTDEVIIEDWSKIYRVVATDNLLTFYATETLSSSIPFVVRCIR